MSRLSEMEERRIEVALASGNRWRNRTDARDGRLKRIRTEGITAVEDPDRVERYEARARKKMNVVVNPSQVAEQIKIERVIGTDDRHNFPTDGEEQKAGHPVARIVEIDGPEGKPIGYGTGFMVSRDLLLTNQHVLRNAREASISGANFGHEYIRRGKPKPGEVFELDPDRFFYNFDELDFALVAVKNQSINGASLSENGAHGLIAETGKILLGKPVNIIQHPLGGPKRYATKGNDLVDRLELFLHYETDTDKGSSGSPVFNVFWEVIALHHSSVPKMRGDTILNTSGDPWTFAQGQDKIDWIANEGVRISRIIAHLKGLNPDQMAGGELLREMFAYGDIANQMAASDISTESSPSILSTAMTDGPRGDNAYTNARTIVHVHGDATINTGDIHTTREADPQDGTKSVSGTESGHPTEALEAKRLRFDEDYSRRRGYDENFLAGISVPLPTVDEERLKELHSDRYGNPVILDYHHYSLVMNADWKMLMWSASNADFSPAVRFKKKRKDYGEDTWRLDPRLPGELQIDADELYDPAKKFDQGHVVSRDQSVWGATFSEAEFANSDTFHFTNCTPQHEQFNRGIFQFKGVWGKLEGHIQRQSNALGGRLVIFAGPVLRKDRAIMHEFGKETGKFWVPFDFWKVVVAPVGDDHGETALKAYGFYLQQEEDIAKHGLETAKGLDFAKFQTVQRSLAGISEDTGVIFPKIVMKADVKRRIAKDSRPKVESLEKLEI